MKNIPQTTSLLCLLIAAPALFSSAASAATITKANNTTALNAVGSWTGGVVPGSTDVALWDSTLTANRTASIGGNLSFAGLLVTTAGGTSTAHTINATTGSVLTLGTQGIDLGLAATDLNINATLNLGADQTWRVGAGRTLTIAPGTGISNTGTSTVTATGTGKIRLGNAGNFFGSGPLVLSGGIDIGSSNSTGRTIANPTTLVGNITFTSTTTGSNGGLKFTDDLTINGTSRTITLVASPGGALNPVAVIGGGTGKIISGGTLILANGNASHSPATSISLISGVTLQTGLRIGDAVTVFAGSPNVISTTGPVTVDVGGILDLARPSSGTASSQSLGSLSGAGLVTSDATTNSVCTLTVDGGTATSSTTFSGLISDSGLATLNLSKTGSTTQILTGNNTYHGTTTVSGGVLQLGNSSSTAAFLPSATACNLNTGGTLKLSFTSNAVQQGVGALSINGVSQPMGIYGPVGSGAEYESSLITGVGKLRVGVITQQPVGLTVLAGGNATFSVTALAPSVSYQWRKAGVAISGATSSSFTLTNVQLADAATYTVMVTYTGGSQLSSAANLVVNQAPIITAQPASVTSVDGVNTHFSVTATGFPAPTFQWKKNGVNISGATGSSLYLGGLSTADAGNYTVVITNSIGSVTSSVATLVVNSSPNVVNLQMGDQIFSWTFDQPVTRGYFLDGQPWIVRPSSGVNLTAVSPARKNNQSVYIWASGSTSNPIVADIDITVKNPPVDHLFNGTAYVDNAAGVFGWDSRGGQTSGNASPLYNAALGWNGSTPLPLAVGDSITTAKSTVQNPMPDRATSLDYLAVLTVLNVAPAADAFRPGVIRTGTDRTNPEILRYSDLINLTPYLIPSPVGSTDLRGATVAAISPEYTYEQISACLPGPGFINTGYSRSEGASALLNNHQYPYTAVYGAVVGNNIGHLAIGTVAGWFTEEERRFCRISYIQRAIDTYSAVKAGLCMEEGAGILPGYSTLITTAGVMLNHSGMKSVNDGVNGVKPWFVFADYACHYHTDGVPAGDLSAGETQSDRLIALYSATTTNYPELNKKDIQPIAVASINTMTMKTDFRWGSSRPMTNIINLKVRITSGPGAGPTIYLITDTVTTGVTDDEKFRRAEGTLYTVGDNTFNYLFGGKVTVKPSWQNGTPTSASVVAFSITASDPSNAQSDDAKWFWRPDGVISTSSPVKFENVKSVCTSPTPEYGSIHSGGTIDQLILLYALGQQSLYKGGVDKYLINAGSRPGFGEVLFDGVYLTALGSGSAGNTRGALWKQKVLNSIGKTFTYTGLGTSALQVPAATAKLWYEP